VKNFISGLSWKSLKGKMLSVFLLTALLPSVLLILFSYLNTSRIVRENVEDLMKANLAQTQSSLEVWVDSYEDILYQIYMNDDIVDMVDNINQSREIAVTTGQLRRTLRGMFYTKEHIKCITILTESGQTVFYDLLTGSSTKTSWMGNMGMSRQEIYDFISKDNETSIIPTRQAGTYASKDYYLFHLGHRIIDYQNVDKPLGVVVVSVDEMMLEEMCASDNSENNYKFMVGRDGKLFSGPDKELLGKKIISWSEDMQERKSRYESFLRETKGSQSWQAAIDLVYDDEFGVDIVQVSDQKELQTRLDNQQRIMLLVLGITALILLLLIITMTRNLMGSINRLVGTMKAAQGGRLSVRTIIDRRTPTEIQIIENQFNQMMDELEQAAVKEKEAGEKQRRAEIAALEAQINPHFLYNTLDTINWMAIDRDEYEISNSITSLAGILRYGIDNSNGEVKVSREMEWLKQYLFLQQTRLKNTFACEVHADPEVLDWKIHKLLFQPFVENAIYHGFKVEKETYILKVSLEPAEGKLRILIWDNGAGMPRDMVDRINRGIYPESRERSCIGMENAITRIKMYYGDKASVEIDSKLGEYTGVSIFIPKILP
jgi:two-component system sensor histidine kinase YesM